MCFFFGKAEKLGLCYVIDLVCGLGGILQLMLSLLYELP